MRRDHLLVAALLSLGAFYVLVAIAGAAGYDAHAYWLTRGGIHYAAGPGARNAYLYSPAFAQAIRPLALLPWPVFAILWSSASAATYVWLLRPAAPPWRLALLALGAGDVVFGNVWWLFAIVLAFGLRRPALWALPLLLKVTPAVGLVWFAVRREWRNLLVALTAAGAVFAVSLCFAPHAWAEWLAFLRRPHAAGTIDRAIPPALRLLGALGITVYAARSDRKALLPIALWLASPVFSINGIAILAAIPRLARRGPVEERVDVAPVPRLRVEPQT